MDFRDRLVQRGNGAEDERPDDGVERRVRQRELLEGRIQDLHPVPPVGPHPLGELGPHVPVGLGEDETG